DSGQLHPASPATSCSRTTGGDRATGHYLSVQPKSSWQLRARWFDSRTTGSAIPAIFGPEPEWLRLLRKQLQRSASHSEETIRRRWNDAGRLHQRQADVEHRYPDFMA